MASGRGRQSLGGGMLGTVALDGTSYILHPEAVLDCFHYFLSRTSTREGNFAKSICKPGDATGYEDAETDKEGKDVPAHVCF